MRSASKPLHPWESVLVDLTWAVLEATYDRALDVELHEPRQDLVSDNLELAVALADARLGRAVEACRRGLGPAEWLESDAD
jgi:hypothetical protein